MNAITKGRIAEKQEIARSLLAENLDPAITAKALEYICDVLASHLRFLPVKLIIGN